MAFKKSRQQKLSDKEKRNTQIFTLVSLLDTSVLNAEQIDFIQRYFKIYNQIKRCYAKLIKQHQEYADFRPKDIKSLADPKGILPYRIFGGIETSVKGLLDSQKTNLSNTLLNLEYKIKRQQQKVKGLEDSLKNPDKTPDKDKHSVRLSIKIPQIKRSLFHARGKLDRMLKKQQRLKTKYQNGGYSICFGSRRLLKERNNIHVNDHDNIRHWKRQWHFRRHDEIFSVGKKDDRYGNGNMQVSMNEAGEFQLRLIVPTAMREQYSFKSVTLPLSLDYRQELLIHHILTYDEDAGTKQPLSIKLKRRQTKGNGVGKIEAHLNIHQAKPHTVTSTVNGAIGVDINADHLAVTETDKHGNRVRSESHYFDLSGSTGQNDNQLSMIIKEIVNHAESLNKSVVIENLNFKQKKRALEKEKLEHKKQYNRMLSSLAYGRITQLFQSKCFRQGVELIKVDPAYTSQLGRIKYEMKLNMTTHESASYVIARKGQGFKEKIPRKLIRFTVSRKQNDKETVPKIAMKTLERTSLENRDSVLSSSVFCNKVSQNATWKHLSETVLITPDGVINQTQRLSRKVLTRLKSSAVNSECYLPV